MGFSRSFIKLIHLSGLPFLVRELIQRRYVTILTFHDPEVSRAEEVFAWLKKKYNIIDLNQFLAASNRSKKNKLPAKSLVITLDDGHRGNYKLLPLLRKYQVPITIFLCAGLVNTNRHFWFRYAVPGTSFRRFKRTPDKERIAVLADSGFVQDKEFSYPQALSRSQVHEMQEWVNFQSHTIYHPCLPQCDDNKAWVEINDSKKMLETDFGLAINAIAYPNGDYGDRETEFSRKAGYTCALTTDTGLNGMHSDLFRLRRISINDHDDLHTVAIKTCGIWGFFRMLAGKTGAKSRA